MNLFTKGIVSKKFIEKILKNKVKFFNIKNGSGYCLLDVYIKCDFQEKTIEIVAFDKDGDLAETLLEAYFEELDEKVTVVLEDTGLKVNIS